MRLNDGKRILETKFSLHSHRFLSRIGYVAVFVELIHRRVRRFLGIRSKSAFLLQVADLACAAELVGLKMDRKLLSRSERYMLGNNKAINKLLLKPLQSKKFR